MNVKRELQNFFDHYGKTETLQAIAEWLEDEAVHCTDRGAEEDRESFDEAAEAVWNCVG